MEFFGRCQVIRVRFIFNGKQRSAEVGGKERKKERKGKKRERRKESHHERLKKKELVTDILSEQT